MRRLVKSLVAAVLIFSVSVPSDAQDEARTVTLGQVGLSFYAVVGGVLQELLENAGYAVQVVEGPHDEIFPMLGRGDVDLLAAAWLPRGHEALYDPVRSTTFKIAAIYQNAEFFWGVPAYVPEAEIASVADLARPEIAARMPSRIVSLPNETGLTIGARRVMEAYGLDTAGYELVGAPLNEWLNTFRSALDTKRWVVVPLWQPLWINAVYQFRRLEEPLGAYGDPDTAYLIGHVQLRDVLDTEALTLLSKVRFEIADVTEMDRLVNVEGLDPREAARRWMKANAEKVEVWKRQ